MPTYTLTGDLGTLVGGDFSTSDVKASLAAAGFVLAGTEARFGGVPITVDTDGTFSLSGIPESTSSTYTFTALYRDPSTMPVVLRSMVVGPFALTADTDLADVAEVDFVAGSPAGLAEIQGFWPIFSDDPPAETTKYGVPVLWIDESETPALVPVNPTLPTWNDATSQMTMPSGVVGVDYVWTSGGGGVGATVTQGSTVATSGAFPRSVVITPVPKPGYSLAAGITTFHHDFPDPAAMVVLASDGFTGADTGSIGGRAMDLAFGGSATSWPAGAFYGITTNKATTTTTLGAYSFTYGTIENLKVEADISAMTPSTGGVYSLIFEVRGFSIRIGAGALRIQGPSSTGTPDLVVQASAQPTGVWSVQLYANTLTVVKGDATTLVYDLLQPQNSGLWVWTGVKPDRNVNLYNFWNVGSGQTATLDNFKITKVGF